MDDDQQGNDNRMHYEGGVPVFNTRLDNLENEAREAKRRDEGYKRKQNELNSLLVWFTGVLAVVGILGAGVSAYQTHIARINASAAQANAEAAKANAAAAGNMVAEMQKSGADTHELAVQAKNQLGELRKSATAALDSNKINRDSLQTVQRAFIVWQNHGMDMFRFHNGGLMTQYIQVRSIWENSGNTAAPVVVQNFRFDQLGREPKPEEFVGNMQNPPAIAVVGPKGPFDSNAVPRQQDFVVRDEGNPPQPVTVPGWVAYGFVAYRDIWHRPHVTETCHFLTYYLPTKDPQFKWENCMHYNCVDGYCPNFDALVKKLPEEK